MTTGVSWSVVAVSSSAIGSALTGCVGGGGGEEESPGEEESGAGVVVSGGDDSEEGVEEDPLLSLLSSVSCSLLLSLLSSVSCSLLSYHCYLLYLVRRRYHCYYLCQCCHRQCRLHLHQRRKKNHPGHYYQYVIGRIRVIC